MTERTDHELFAAFSGAALPAAEWNHRAHVRVAFLYVTRYTLDEAHVRMRAGIIRMNMAHGLEESIERGYHETLTRAWLELTAHAVAKLTSPDATSADLLASAPELLSRTLVLAHYTRERLARPHARAVFVPPDIAPFAP